MYRVPTVTREHIQCPEEIRKQAHPHQSVLACIWGCNHVGILLRIDSGCVYARRSRYTTCTTYTSLYSGSLPGTAALRARKVTGHRFVPKQGRVPSQCLWDGAGSVAKWWQTESQNGGKSGGRVDGPTWLNVVAWWHGGGLRTLLGDLVVLVRGWKSWTTTYCTRVAKRHNFSRLRWIFFL